MELGTYQYEAGRTAVYPHVKGNLAYAVLGLCGEAGELANKTKKLQRDNKSLTDEAVRKELCDELGDVLWYVQQVATELHEDLDHIAFDNLRKLKARHQNKTLHGSGDQR